MLKDSVKKFKKCKYCLSTQRLTVDHKIPKSRGGTDDKSNLQCLCRRCNSRKSSMTDREVRSLFKWFLEIQEERGDKEYELSNGRLRTTKIKIPKTKVKIIEKGNPTTDLIKDVVADLGNRFRWLKHRNGQWLAQAKDIDRTKHDIRVVSDDPYISVFKLWIETMKK